MKVFWAIIGLLLIGAVATLLWTDRGLASPKATPTGGPAATTPGPSEPLPEPTPKSPTTESNRDSTPATKPATPPATDAPLESMTEAKPVAAPEPAPTPALAESKPAPETKPAETKPVEIKPTEVTSAEPSTLANKPAEPGADNAVLAAPVAAPLPAAKIEKKDDGSMLIDGRFTVKGSGTIEDPYVLPWELFTSVEEVYKPQQGKKELPGRITMFDAKFVRIAGYVAYPMFVEQPRELLSMLNQWDGCCIGIPPSPYDAIEVKLDRVVTANERLAAYGTIEGKLGVKPYLAGDWLVGLYLMENAKLTVKEYNVGS